MLKQPRLKRNVISYTAENGAGALLLSEKYRELSISPLYSQLVPLLDGQLSLQLIVSRLTPRFAPQQVLDAIYTLHKRGLLVDTSDPEQAPYWEAQGLNEAALASKSVAVRALGGISDAPFVAALAAFGLATGGAKPAVELVLTDDYLRSELDAYNRQASRPWLLVRPVGMRIWLGPLFVPGVTACWECLAQRMRLNQCLEIFVTHKTGAFPVPTPLSLPATEQLAAQQAAAQLAFALADENHGVLANKLIVWDYATLEMQSHIVVKRPQCPVCGDPGFYEPEPILLQSNLALDRGDTSYRSVSAEDTFNQYKHHISPISGLIGHLVRTPGGKGIFVYGANNNVQQETLTWEQLEHAGRFSAGGKGSDDNQAKVSALCEALERYSSYCFGDEAYILASYEELGPAAAHPGPILNFSAAQYENRVAYNQRARVNRVPQPFDEAARIAWTKVWSLTNQTWKYVPTGICFFNGHRNDPAFYFTGDSNGNAAGSSLEDAILQGFLELVERDSAALWWFNRLPRPRVALEGIDDELVAAMSRYYTSLQRDFWLLDITSDLGIPSFIALSQCTDRRASHISHGLGTHFNPRVAAIRALTELNQLLPLSLARAEREDRRLPEQADTGRTLATANLADEGYYLLPTPNLPVKRISDFATPDFADIAAAVRYCLGKVEQLGSEMLVHNLTRPDVGLPVVKVIVPTMRHYWRRLAPGRLYDVPVKMGWLATPHSESHMNSLEISL